MIRPDELVLAPYISQRQLQWLKDEIRVFPCHTNRASGAAHPCVRFLVYCRTNWRDRRPPSPELQCIFTLGHDLEEVVFRWLKERLKLDIIQPKDKTLVWDAFQLTGHLDAYVQEYAHWIPFEVKGVSVATWNTVNCFEDMVCSNKSWVRRYPGQLLLYLLLDNKAYGRFVLFQKETGRLKDFPVVLDDHLHLAEEILLNLERVNQHVAAKTLPDRYYEPGPVGDLCEDCDFEAICLPGGSYASAVEIMDDPAAEMVLARYLALQKELEPFSAINREFEAAKKQLRTYFAAEKKERIILGGKLITGKMVTVGPSEGYSYWKWSIKKGKE